MHLKSSKLSQSNAVPLANTRWKRTKADFLKNWQLYLFLLPTISYFLIFHYVPMYGAQIAFKYYNAAAGFWGSPWAGFDHFTRFFNSFYFWRLLKNTLILNAYLLLLFPLPIILALSINEIKNGPFKKWAQTLTYAPHFISVVVVVGMLVAFLDPRTGLINHFIVALGGNPINFIQEAGWFRHIFVWSHQWQHLGWGSIIYLAALAGVNPELHDVAKVDGASIFQRIIYINIPTILPTIIILLILEFGNFMTIGFEKVLLLQNELNSSTSDVIQTFVYSAGLLKGQYSYAAAIDLFNSIINILLIVTMNWVARKTTESSLW